MWCVCVCGGGGVTNRANAIKLLINDFKNYNFLMYLENRSYYMFLLKSLSVECISNFLGK